MSHLTEEHALQVQAVLRVLCQCPIETRVPIELNMSPTPYNLIVRGQPSGLHDFEWQPHPCLESTKKLRAECWIQAHTLKLFVQIATCDDDGKPITLAYRSHTPLNQHASSWLWKEIEPRIKQRSSSLCVSQRSSSLCGHPIISWRQFADCSPLAFDIELSDVVLEWSPHSDLNHMMVEEHYVALFRFSIESVHDAELILALMKEKSMLAPTKEKYCKLVVWLNATLGLPHPLIHLISQYISYPQSKTTTITTAKPITFQRIILQQTHNMPLSIQCYHNNI